MSSTAANSIALLIRSQPFAHRAPRADLDIALAAAALDFELEVYFLGHAVMQLADERDVTGALLPPGYRAWAALPDLADLRVYVEQEWLDHCRGKSISLTLPVEGLSATQMQEHWRHCRHVMVL